MQSTLHRHSTVKTNNNIHSGNAVPKTRPVFDYNVQVNLVDRRLYGPGSISRSEALYKLVQWHVVGVFQVGRPVRGSHKQMAESKVGRVRSGRWRTLYDAREPDEVLCKACGEAAQAPVLFQDLNEVRFLRRRDSVRRRGRRFGISRGTRSCIRRDERRRARRGRRSGLPCGRQTGV